MSAEIDGPPLAVAQAPRQPNEEEEKKNAAASLGCRFLGIEQLRDYQREAVAKFEPRGRRTFLIMPTGSGKTPTMLFPVMQRAILVLDSRDVEPTISVFLNPLKSLESDLAARLGVYKDESSRYLNVMVINGPDCIPNAQHVIDSWNFRGDRRSLLIICNPESFAQVRENLFRARSCVRWIFLDEGHVYSPWMDFRPEFAGLTGVGRDFAMSSIVAASATLPLALEQNLADIFGEDVGKFDRFMHWRPRLNLHYHVISENEMLRNLRKMFDPKSFPMLIIVSSLLNLNLISEHIQAWCGNDAEIRVGEYAAGFSTEHKVATEKWFREGAAGSKKILIATKSFGMGIDVAHIQSVVIYGVPSTLEEVIQSWGRCGRGTAELGGALCHCWLVSTPNTVKNASKETRILLGKGANALSAKEAEQSGAVSQVQVCCDHCQAWRAWPDGKDPPGEVDSFMCSDINKRCKTAAGRLSMCICLLLKRFFLRIYPLDVPPGPEEREACGRCDFCVPGNAVAEIKPGDWVKCLSSSSKFFGCEGQVESVANVTRLRVNFGLPHGLSTIQHALVICLDARPGERNVPVFAPPIHSRGRGELKVSLISEISKAMPHLANDMLLTDAAMILLLKHRPTSVDGVTLLIGEEVHPLLLNVIARTISKHQLEALPNTESRSEPKKRAARKRQKSTKSAKAQRTIEDAAQVVVSSPMPVQPPPTGNAVELDDNHGSFGDNRGKGEVIEGPVDQRTERRRRRSAPDSSLLRSSQRLRSRSQSGQQDWSILLGDEE